MKQINLIKAALTLIVITLIIYPGYLFLYLYPSFHNLIIENKENDAQDIVKHISDVDGVREFLLINDKTPLKSEYKRRIIKHMDDFKLIKIRIFSDSGEVIYSSKESEIGNLNSKPYFVNIVSKGEIFSKYVKKGGPSAEGYDVVKDVVEIYIPIMIDKKFIGAVEVYYDITTASGMYKKLIRQANITLLILGLMLLIGVGITFYKAYSNLKKRELAEKKLKEQEEEIESIKDIIPICSYCKNIRNDDGYWAQVEEYIHNSTHVDLSHGICPDCIKKQFPDNKELHEKLGIK
jgi:sensor histidine kinase regulating citrate/malate metabolism